jgi:NADPH-dependent curcumin reductase CurA
MAEEKAMSVMAAPEVDRAACLEGGEREARDHGIQSCLSWARRASYHARPGFRHSTLGGVFVADVNRQWLLKKRPFGMVSRDNFEYREAPVPKIGAGEALIRTRYLSFDPTQRGWMEDRPSYMPPVALGEPMRAGCIGEVVASEHPSLKAGDWVQGLGGWQDYFVVNPGAGFLGVSKLPEGIDPILALSALGTTGLTAYWGLLDLGKPQRGETVLVSGAAGATGSVAGQIARIKGCRVVGIAGGPEKCRWLKEKARFDDVIDYKRENVDARIGETCPKGVDVYFDNVGGSILEAALNHLAMRARVVLCGGISSYNATAPVPGPANLMNLVIMRARMEGFIVIDYMDRSHVAVPELLGWVRSGELVNQVDVQEGFEHIPDTLNRLFTGQNMGKQVLKL